MINSYQETGSKWSTGIIIQFEVLAIPKISHSLVWLLCF